MIYIYIYIYTQQIIRNNYIYVEVSDKNKQQTHFEYT